MEAFRVFGKFVLDDKEAKKGLNKMDAEGAKVGDRFDGMGSKLATFGKVAGGAIMAVGGAIVGLVAKTNETTAAINKFSSQTGTTTEQFQKLDYVFKQVGWSMEDAAGDISALGEKALDALNDSTGDTAMKFQELGVSLTDANGKMRSQGDITEDVIRGLQGMEDVTKRNAYASDLLSTSGEELTQVLDMTNEQFTKMQGKANIISEDDLEKARKFNEQWVGIKDQFGNVVTTLGTKLMPIVSKVFTFLEEHSPIIQEVTGKAFGVVGNVLSTLGDVFTAIQPTISMLFNSFMENLPIIQSSVGEFVSNVSSAFEGLFGLLSGLWDRYGSGIMAIIKPLFEGIVIVVKGFIKQINLIFKAFGQLFKGDFKGFFKTMKEIVKNSIDTFIAVFKKLFDGAIASVKLAFGIIVDVVKGGFNGIIEFIKGLAGAFIDAGKAVINGLVDGIKYVWNSLVEWTTGAVDGFLEMFSSIDLVEIGHNIIQGLIDGITGMWDTVKNTVGNIGESIKTKFKDMLGIHSPSRVFKGYGNNIIQGLDNGINELKPQVENTMKSLANMTKTYMESTIGELHKAQQARAELNAMMTGGAGGGQVLPTGDMSGAYYHGRPDKETGYSGGIKPGINYIMRESELDPLRYIKDDKFNMKEFIHMTERLTDKLWGDLSVHTIEGIANQIFPQYQGPEAGWSNEFEDWVDAMSGRFKSPSEDKGTSRGFTQNITVNSPKHLNANEIAEAVEQNSRDLAKQL